MKKIKPIKTAWMCIGTWPDEYYPDVQSVAFTRKDSIKKILDVSAKDWNFFKSRGWQCVRVGIDFKLLSNPKEIPTGTP